MSSLQRGLLAVTLVFATAWGCTETASIDNDRKGSNVKKDAGTSTDDDDSTSDETSSDDDSTGQTDDDDTSSTDDDSSSTDDGSDDTSSDDEDIDAGTTSDAGKDAGKDASTGTDAGKDASTSTDAGKPATSTIAGSATKNKCSSYGAAKSGMCGSYYCGVTEAQIMSELPADTLCPDPTRICDATLVKVVGDCARNTKALNLGLANAQLKPKVEACVLKNPTFADLSTSCIGCFLDVALCAGDKCLLECLTGDSAGCDSCRAKNNCDKPVFSCAKLPNPF